MIAEESIAQAGSPLSQRPPAIFSALPVAKTRTQSSREPVGPRVKATHRPSADTASPPAMGGTGTEAGAAVLVVGSKRVIVERGPATNSNQIDPSEAEAVG
jgi:hypothetical protein